MASAPGLGALKVGPRPQRGWWALVFDCLELDALRAPSGHKETGLQSTGALSAPCQQLYISVPDTGFQRKGMVFKKCTNYQPV